MLRFGGGKSFPSSFSVLFPRVDLVLTQLSSCRQDYQLALVFQMTANDHSAPLPSHQKFVLRLKVERRPLEGGGVGEGLVADLHLVE